MNLILKFSAISHGPWIKNWYFLQFIMVHELKINTFYNLLWFMSFKLIFSTIFELKILKENIFNFFISIETDHKKSFKNFRLSLWRCLVTCTLFYVHSTVYKYTTQQIRDCSCSTLYRLTLQNQVKIVFFNKNTWKPGKKSML